MKSDLIPDTDCYVQHGSAGEPMVTERCPARTRPHTERHYGRGPIKSHWEVYAAGRWRRLMIESISRDTGEESQRHFVLIDRKRTTVRIEVNA